MPVVRSAMGMRRHGDGALGHPSERDISVSHDITRMFASFEG